MSRQMNWQMNAGKIEKIDSSLIPWRQGEPPPEEIAIKELEIGEALRFPCRWKHDPWKDSKYNRGDKCRSRSFIHLKAKKFNMKLKATCVDGYVYVLRKVYGFYEK